MRCEELGINPNQYAISMDNWMFFLGRQGFTYEWAVTEWYSKAEYERFDKMRETVRHCWDARERPTQ